MSDNFGDKSKVLGLLARLALVAVHPKLDEGYKWDTATEVDPHSPKFDALAKRICRRKTCGHIVFVENIAAHVWIREVLVKAGISRDRIAILNAKTAKASADRQRIAEAFNGNPEEKIEPQYDVVIANAIAYEGIDLQTRTCAIHHMDLPWEPATLQQRNGRGHRQGNTFSTIEICYYFARRSLDGLRYNLIQGKHGWMTNLLESQMRDTNNPGAQAELSAEETLLLVSRNPEKTQQRMQDVRKRREEEARTKKAKDTARLAMSINARYRRAEKQLDPAEATRLREEAKKLLNDLNHVDVQAWPWAQVAAAARETALLVPVNGECPVHEGLRVGIPNPWDPDQIDFIEFGRIQGKSVGVRHSGAPLWTEKKVEEVAQMQIKIEHLRVTWPVEEDVLTSEVITGWIRRRLQSGSWTKLGWKWASDSWLAEIWPISGDAVIRTLADASWYGTQNIPGLLRGELVIGKGKQLHELTAFPPTLDGWRTFLQHARESKDLVRNLQLAAQYWWGRSIPRGLRTNQGGEA